MIRLLTYRYQLLLDCINGIERSSLRGRARDHAPLVFVSRLKLPFSLPFQTPATQAKRGEVVRSRCLGCHGFWVSTNRGPADMTENSEKVDMSDFPVHDHTQKQNGSPYFSSIVHNANGRLCQERLLRSSNFATMVT